MKDDERDGGAIVLLYAPAARLYVSYLLASQGKANSLLTKLSCDTLEQREEVC